MNPATIKESWRCRLGRKQLRDCKSDGGYCYVGECPHGAWVPVGESTRDWTRRVDYRPTDTTGCTES
ncbi:MAG: hypothetical protein WC322_03290 [Candidatus Paceibacterota bacterium]|jgi:hypothetical protein